jgi:hypothetical protein
MLRYGDGWTFFWSSSLQSERHLWHDVYRTHLLRSSSQLFTIMCKPHQSMHEFKWYQGVMLNGVGLGMLSPNTPLSLSRVATQQQQLCIAELDPDSWVRFHCCLTSHCTPQYHQYLLSPDPWCCNPSRKTQNCSSDPPSRESTLGAHDWQRNHSIHVLGCARLRTKPDNVPESQNPRSPKIWHAPEHTGTQRPWQPWCLWQPWHLWGNFIWFHSPSLALFSFLKFLKCLPIRLDTHHPLLTQYCWTSIFVRTSSRNAIDSCG